MKKPETQNLTAWITGRNLNVFQKADAVIEYNKLLDYVSELEQLLIQPVSQQSELLKDFQEHYQSNKMDDERTFDWNIENFLKPFYCAVENMRDGKRCESLCNSCINMQS